MTNDKWIFYSHDAEYKEVYNDTSVNKKLSKENFMMIYCNSCGSQRCEGIDSDWFNGCKYKNKLKAEGKE